MDMEQAIMWVMAIGAIVGGIDRIFGNNLGLGKKFEDGFLLMGSIKPFPVSIRAFIGYSSLSQYKITG